MPAYARASEEEYRMVCAELMIRNEYPSLNELDWGVAISGLDMFTKTLACGVEGCGKLFASGGAIRKHYAGAHGVKGAQIPTRYNITTAQRMDNNHHRMLFHVAPPPDQSIPLLDKDWITKLDEEIEDVMKAIELDATDARYINALLRKTKWLEHVRGYEPMELRSLVGLPIADEFPQLKQAVEWIIETAMNTSGIAPTALLQRLNTKNMAL